MKNILFILVLLSACNSKKNSNTVSDYLPQNKYQNVVSDHSRLFTGEQKDSLAERLIEYENKTSNQMVIITVDSISPYANIQEYATAIGDYWGIGEKDKDNGLIIAFSEKLRQIGIATGNGTQKTLTDSICKRIIDSTIIPRFKNGEYYQGISRGVDSLIDKWK